MSKTLENDFEIINLKKVGNAETATLRNLKVSKTLIYIFMKKKLFLKNLFMFSIVTIGLTSCSSEENITSKTELVAPASSKTPEIIAFQNALIQQMKDRNQPENKNADVSAQSMKNNAKVIDTAKELLIANGVSESNILSKTKGNEAAIRSLALKILAEQTKITSNNN